MIQKHLIVLFICLFSGLLYAQSDDFDSILKQIEQNNGELRTYKPYKESTVASMLSKNVLPNPEIGAYYLLFGSPTSRNHVELEATQSFKLPVAYRARKELIQKEGQYIDYQYEEKRQDILLQAKLLLLNIVTVNKTKAVEQQRLTQAQQLFDQNKKLFDQGEMGILEFNKSKVALMQVQFKLQNLSAERDNALINLRNLNGGHPISVNANDFPEDFTIPNKEALWRERTLNSRVLQRYKYAEEIAKEKIAFTRIENLPEFKVGYAVQGLFKDNLQGVFVGSSIPLWGKFKRRTAAKLNLVAQEHKTAARLMEIQNKFDSQYNEYEVLLKKYTEYKNTLDAIQSEELLLKAYQAGEISFSEYFLERDFYHDAHDAMLGMEKELHVLKTYLLHHKI